MLSFFFLNVIIMYILYMYVFFFYYFNGNCFNFYILCKLYSLLYKKKYVINILDFLIED